MKIYIIAGEASGDLHGSNLIKALKHERPDLQCRGWGGDLMQAAGLDIVKHYRDLAFMGFIEVAKNICTILQNISYCKSDILQYAPDALVLIDYPGFNLRIAKWAKQKGIKVIYYISPQIWAWHTSRVHDIKRDVDKMLVILPFEPKFYQKYGVEATYVGHPLLDAIQQNPDDTTSDAERINAPIALLPGSRKQEIDKILKPMLEVTLDFPEEQFIIAAAPSLPLDTITRLLTSYPNVSISQGNTYQILRSAKAALIKSGTSTLETALIGTPQVVCYAGNPISYQIAKRLVDIKYISLVNLIADQPLVLELIQGELNRKNLRIGLQDLLNPERVRQIKKGYAEINHILGSGGASANAAKEILKSLER